MLVGLLLLKLFRMGECGGEIIESGSVRVCETTHHDVRDGEVQVLYFLLSCRVTGLFFHAFIIFFVTLLNNVTPSH